jgi:hypothetical protein
MDSKVHLRNTETLSIDYKLFLNRVNLIQWIASPPPKKKGSLAMTALTGFYGISGGGFAAT